MSVGRAGVRKNLRFASKPISRDSRHAVPNGCRDTGGYQRAQTRGPGGAQTRRREMREGQGATHPQVLHVDDICWPRAARHKQTGSARARAVLRQPNAESSSAPFINRPSRPISASRPLWRTTVANARHSPQTTFTHSLTKRPRQPSSGHSHRGQSDGTKDLWARCDTRERRR